MDDCYNRKQTINVDGTTVNIISKEDLIKNKKASGRNSDIADVEKLEKR